MSVVNGQQVAICELKTPTSKALWTSVAKRAPYRVAMATAFSLDPRMTIRVVVGSCQHKNQTNQYLVLQDGCTALHWVCSAVRVRVSHWRGGCWRLLALLALRLLVEIARNSRRKDENMAAGAWSICR